MDSGKATWHLHGLFGPQETLNGNDLCCTINPSQQNLHMKMILSNMCIYKDLLYKEIFLFAKKPKSILHYYKNPKPLKTKVRITDLSFDTLEL